MLLHWDDRDDPCSLAERLTQACLVAHEATAIEHIASERLAATLSGSIERAFGTQLQRNQLALAYLQSLWRHPDDETVNSTSSSTC